MEFSEFFVELLQHKKCQNVAEFYRSQGGAKYFGISENHIRQIARGDRLPTEEFLANIFAITPTPLQQSLIFAFFGSHLKSNQRGKKLMQYLKTRLGPALEQEEENIWERKKKESPDKVVRIYSDEQLDFLIANPDVFHFFKSVHIRDDRDYFLKDCPLSEDKITRLLELGLLKLIKDDKTGKQKFRSGDYIFRVPSLKTRSSPKSRAKGFDFILAHVDEFFSREGSEKQAVVLSTQMSDPAFIRALFQNAETFHNYVQTGAKFVHDPDQDKPVVFFMAIKELSDSEL